MSEVETTSNEIINDILDDACTNSQSILSQYDCAGLSTSQAQAIIDTYAAFSADGNCDLSLCGLSPGEIDDGNG